MKFPRISRGTLLAGATVIIAGSMVAAVVFTAPDNSTVPPVGSDSIIVIPSPSTPPVTSTVEVNGTELGCATYRDAIICTSDKGLPDGWTVGGKLRTAENDGWDLLFATGDGEGKVDGFTADSRDADVMSGMFTAYSTISDHTCLRAERVWYGGFDEAYAPSGCFFMEKVRITVEATS